MQAYKAVYNGGRFIPLEMLEIPEGSHAIITILDSPVWDDNDNPQLEAFDDFMAEIHGCGETVPEFERALLHREVDI